MQAGGTAATRDPEAPARKARYLVLEKLRKRAEGQHSARQDLFDELPLPAANGGLGQWDTPNFGHQNCSSVPEAAIATDVRPRPTPTSATSDSSDDDAAGQATETWSGTHADRSYSTPTLFLLSMNAL